jgi:iron complex outermembrane receptor protein
LALQLTGLRSRDGAQPLVPLSGGPSYSVSRPREGRLDVDSVGAALRAAFATPAGALSLTTGYSDWKMDPYINSLYTPFGLSDSDETQAQRLWSEEIKLVSDSKADLHWQAGAFYSDGRTEGNTDRYLSFITPLDTPYEHSHCVFNAKSASVFGDVTFKVADGLTLTPGLRVENSRKSMDRLNLLDPVQFPPYSLDRESNALLPKLAADYALAHDVMLYASVGAGYKPGGFSGFTDNEALAAFGPEHTIAYEAGLTRTSSDKSLTSTLRVFWYDITGYQIERSFGPDYVVVNAPRARSLGGEIELAWKPVAGLTLAANVGYTDVTLRQFTDPATGINYDGKRAPYVPAYNLNFRADYQDAHGWFVGTQVTANGTTYYKENEDPHYGQKPYALLGAHLGYATGHWRVNVYGDNLTGRAYYTAITPDVEQGTPGAPRTYGVEVAVKF